MHLRVRRVGPLNDGRSISLLQIAHNTISMHVGGAVGCVVEPVPVLATSTTVTSTRPTTVDLCVKVKFTLLTCILRCHLYMLQATFPANLNFLLLSVLKLQVRAPKTDLVQPV